ncbi:MAG: NAD-dependent epimerase/dehydratase family protein [Phycisphaerales bacterium]
MAQSDANTASIAAVAPSGRRVLVSGGAGFIGSHLVELLLARGDEVTVVDNLSTGRRANLPAKHERLRFVEADLSHALGALGKGECFEQIYHLAAAVGVKLVIDDPIRSIDVNVEETSQLLRFSVTHGPSGGRSRVLIASSSEVYGKSSHSPFREEDDVVYGPTSLSRWSYACAKAIDEYLSLAYSRKKNLGVTVARFFNTVGPRQIGEYGMVVPRFVAWALQGKPLEVYGDGSQSRCFCDVRDVSGVLPGMLETDSTKGGIYNVGSDRPITIRALAELVIKTLGSSSQIRTVPYAEAYPAGFEDLQQRRPALEKLKGAVGFSPRIELEQTIRDVATWMKTSGVGHSHWS